MLTEVLSGFCRSKPWSPRLPENHFIHWCISPPCISEGWLSLDQDGEYFWQQIFFFFFFKKWLTYRSPTTATFLPSMHSWLSEKGCYLLSRLISKFQSKTANVVNQEAPGRIRSVQRIGSRPLSPGVNSWNSLLIGPEVEWSEVSRSMVVLLWSKNFQLVHLSVPKHCWNTGEPSFAGIP